MQNSDLFLDAFRDIEKYLKSQKPSSNYIPFGKLVIEVSKDDAIVQSFQNDLLEFAELRNAIVHDKEVDEDGNVVVIAEPHSRTVSRIQKISQILANPPSASQFGSREVFTINHDETIELVLPTLCRKNYSQAPVVQGDSVKGLLTFNTIARWIGNSIIYNNPINYQTDVNEVLKFTEISDNYLLLPIKENAFTILQLFQKARNERQTLDAILLTENGKLGEKLLGIVTIFDVPKIQSLIYGGIKK